MKSFKLVVTGTGIIMCTLLATIVKIEISPSAAKTVGATQPPSPKPFQERDARVTAHAISYQVGLCF